MSSSLCINVEWPGIGRSFILKFVIMFSILFQSTLAPLAPLKHLINKYWEINWLIIPVWLFHYCQSSKAICCLVSMVMIYHAWWEAWCIAAWFPGGCILNTVAESYLQSFKLPLSDDLLLNTSVLHRVLGQMKELSFWMFFFLSLLETQIKIRIWHFSSDILRYCHSPTLVGLPSWISKRCEVPWTAASSTEKRRRTMPCWHGVQAKTSTKLRPWGGEGRPSNLCFQTHTVEFHLEGGLVLHSLPRGLCQQTVNICLSWTVSTHIENFFVCA